MADRVVGGDVRGDAAQRRDRFLHLLDAAIGAGANDEIDLVGQIADRGVVAGELLGRGQRADRAVDIVQRALDAGERLAVAAILAAAVDALARASGSRSPANSMARRGSASVSERRISASSSRNAAIDWSRRIGTPQRLHLAGDLLQLPLEARQCRAPAARPAAACAVGFARYVRSRRARRGAPRFRRSRIADRSKAFAARLLARRSAAAVGNSVCRLAARPVRWRRAGCDRRASARIEPGDGVVELIGETAGCSSGRGALPAVAGDSWSICRVMLSSRR